jgi:hypothetical protein
VREVRKFFGQREFRFALSVGISADPDKRVGFCPSAKQEMAALAERTRRDDVQYSGSFVQLMREFSANADLRGMPRADVSFGDFRFG